MNPCVELCWNRFGRQYSSECDDFCDYAKAVLETKKLQEAIDQISEKHGRWHDVYMVDDEISSMVCSVCGYRHTANWRTTVEYCPNCGAKMDTKVDFAW